MSKSIFETEIRRFCGETVATVAIGAAGAFIFVAAAYGIHKHSGHIACRQHGGGVMPCHIKFFR